MDAPMRLLRRAAIVNDAGERILRSAEGTLGPAGMRQLREILWTFRLYLYVTPGPLLIQRALAIFPEPDPESAPRVLRPTPRRHRRRALRRRFARARRPRGVPRIDRAMTVTNAEAA